jgi:hypothetical protein
VVLPLGSDQDVPTSLKQANAPILFFSYINSIYLFKSNVFNRFKEVQSRSLESAIETYLDFIEKERRNGLST